MYAELVVGKKRSLGWRWRKILKWILKMGCKDMN
jgi:hypothetical protein